MSKIYGKISGIPYEWGDGMYDYKEWKHKVRWKKAKDKYRKNFKRKYNRYLDKLFKISDE